jgi:hypothetical protein
MGKFITVTTNFVDGSRQSEMTEEIDALKATAKIIGTEGNLEDEIQELIEQYLVSVKVLVNIDNISTLNAVPDKERMTIRLTCGSEMTTDEHLSDFVERMNAMD